MNKNRLYEMIEDLKKDNCRCQDNLTCTTCAILNQLIERIVNE